MTEKHQTCILNIPTPNPASCLGGPVACLGFFSACSFLSLALLSKLVGESASQHPPRNWEIVSFRSRVRARGVSHVISGRKMLHRGCILIRSK